MWGRAQRASYCGASGFVKDIAEHVIDDIGHRLSCGVTVDRAQPLIPFYRSQNLGCPGIIHFLQITPIGFVDKGGFNRASERTFAWLGRCCRLARGAGRNTSGCSAALILMADIPMLLRRFVRPCNSRKAFESDSQECVPRSSKIPRQSRFQI
mgnify:CR=1 FL=1